MKIKYSKIKVLCLLLSLLLFAATLSSCKGRPLSTTKLAVSEVGKVGEYTVLYEELYFLAKGYTEALEGSYKNDPEGLKKAVWASVNENITENYAMLELCKQNGISYDEKSLRKDVERAIEIYIQTEYEGKRSDYFKSQKEEGLTDHYVRFVTGVDLLYAQLATKFKTDGIIPNSDNDLIEYIQENFAHTWHIAVFVNSDEERDEKLAKINEAKALLDNGASMYELIGSKYNEDVTPDYLADAYGYYFPRGMMDEKYEDVAFALRVGDNEIVSSRARNSFGKNVECFYLIERLPTTTEDSRVEIEKNIDTLSDSVTDAIINEKKESIQKTLHFEPNDFAKSLDITALEEAKNGFDYQLVIIVSLCVLSLALAVIVVIVIRRERTKRFQKTIKRKKD